MHTRLAIVLTIFMTATAPATGTTVTTFDDANDWKNAVDDNYQTIDFTGGEFFTLVGNDYFDEFGVSFIDNSYYWTGAGFKNDEWGLYGPGGAWITFETLQHSVAFDFPGMVWVDLYRDGELIYQAPEFGGAFGGGGVGQFGGLVSSEAFDMMYLYKPKSDVGSNVIGIDDMHFGTFIPAPGTLALLGFAAFLTPRRRLTGHGDALPKKSRRGCGVSVRGVR